MNPNEKSLVKQLKKLSPGKQSFEIFVEMARLNVINTYELFIYKIDGDKKSVFLDRRSKDDKFWKNKYAFPGVVILASDNTLNDSYNRLYKTEVKNITITKPTFRKVCFTKNARGSSMQLFHTAKYIAGPLDNFFPVENLPKNTLKEHIASIKEMAELF